MYDNAMCNHIYVYICTMATSNLITESDIAFQLKMHVNNKHQYDKSH